MKINPRGLALKYWYIAALLVIVIISFWFRAMPARFGELPGLDEFYFYRMSEYALQNNWQQPEVDTIRYYPTGVPHEDADFLIPTYLPAMMYAFFGLFGMSMPYLHFALIYPAIMASLGIVAGFFLGKELLNSNKAGLMIAFFMAITPAFITRTAASFEKEAVAALFMLLAMYLFIRGFKKSSLKCGIAAGLSMAVLCGSWGGAQYVYMLISGFMAVLFLANMVLAVLGYLFTGLKKYIGYLEPYFGIRMLKVYAPMVILGIFVPQVLPRHLDITSMSFMFSYIVIAVLALRVAAERFGLVKRENMQYFIPAVLVVGALAVLFGSMFFEPLGTFVNDAVGSVFIKRDVVGTTVAENTPGDWSSIQSMLGTGFSAGLVPQLGFMAPYLAIWVFMVVGVFLLAYKIFRTGDILLFMPILWVLSSIWGTLIYVRLMFLLGPGAAIVAGYFVYWLVSRANTAGKKLQRLSFNVMIRGVQKRASAVSVILALLVIAILAVNFAEGYVYSNGITPSICFADSRILIDGQKCLVINEDGSYTYAAGQPWYEAMQFLDGTDKNSSVLSWWDFGYWFQTRGHKPSVADGGNIYTKKDHEIAEWFISPVSNWSGWVPWLEYHKVSHIFMDYTLPGKYGAISRIATNGAETRGFLQLSQSNVFTQNGKTIYEFKVGPYLIWLPISETGGVNGSPVFVVTQNDQYYSKQYINYVCTDKGVMRVGNETPSMGGCVALSKFGVFYIDEADKNSIFARLMFMEGYDLPLKKVFDNGYIIIYETGYNESGSSA